MLPPSTLTLTLTTLTTLLPPALAGIGPPQPGPPVPPKVAPTKLDNFTWTDPFQQQQPPQPAACESTRTFAATEYQLHDLFDPEPHGLAPYSDALKTFFAGHPYPGGWHGVDAHGYERTLLKMAYRDVPRPVRAWIADQQQQIDSDSDSGDSGGSGKGSLFAVYDKPSHAAHRVVTPANLAEPQDDDAREWDAQRIVIFAPGALYENLPLWVAEGSECQGTLANLKKYSPERVDGGVIAWPTAHTTPARRQGRRQMEFTIKAQVLGTAATQEESDNAGAAARDEL